MIHPKKKPLILRVTQREVKSTLLTQLTFVINRVATKKQPIFTLMVLFVYAGHTEGLVLNYQFHNLFKVPQLCVNPHTYNTSNLGLMTTKIVSLHLLIGP